MTAIEDRPRMLAEEFERIALAAEREGIRMEFIHGRIGVKAAPDGDHDEIIRWVMKRCLQQRPDLWLYPERGLRVETHRKGHARPDGVLAPEGSFAGQGEWASAERALMVVEVTSYDTDTDTDRRDRDEEPRAYAETGIPVHLLADRDGCEVLVFGEPEDGTYVSLVRRPFGRAVALPDPVGITLDTEPFKAWVR
ncbi:Uma2 family endonuclease [Kitasatospora sp. NPDC088346]|uniref:Uma2 family endonuclease n=1 Tax=Kitasatospora sp. NPDC088346 TaxID=3364073 RepID=UPI00380A4561